MKSYKIKLIISARLVPNIKWDKEMVKLLFTEFNSHNSRIKVFLRIQKVYFCLLNSQKYLYITYYNLNFFYD